MSRSDTKCISRAPTKSKVELFVALINEFQPLANVKNNSIFLFDGSPRCPSVDTVK